MSNHLKAYNAPKSWTIHRKVNKWIIRPSPGAHPLERAMPVGLLLKQLGCGQTSREAKKIVNQKAVQVDGTIVKDSHTSIGFMDTIKILPATTLRCSLDDKGRLHFIKIPEAETSKKICQIKGKRTIRKGKIQLNLSDGRNILIEKNDYAVGDSLLIEVPKQKIIEHLPLAKGNTAFLIKGKHISMIGTIDDIQGNRIWCTKDKKRVETLKKFAFVIGKNKPAVSI